MSQHDYDITTSDADTGPTMRGAINSALQALASNNSGTAAPSTPYAYMFWVDTSTATPTLKQRNSDNTAWVSLFQITASQWVFLSDILVSGVTIGRGAGSISTNSALGSGALAANTTGSGNVAVGANALSSNLNGQSNQAIGYNALSQNTSGSLNVAIGQGALYSNTTGLRNIGIGVGAGDVVAAGTPNQTSSESIYIGRTTRASVDGNTNEIVIGNQAVGNGSNTVTLGNDSITKTVLKGVIQKKALDTAPASATAAGTLGEIRVTATHIYVCTATNTWVRTALTTW
jgi:hypothetical protein